MVEVRRWGLVGTSGISHDFAAALKRTPGAVLQAVTSRDAEGASRFARAHGFATVHSTIDAFVADPAIDIVYLAVPTRLHHALGLAVLEAGKHLLCEKPFTTGEAQAADLIARARTRGLFCMEAMWLRFNTAIGQCRDDMASGRLGRLSTVTMDIGYAKDLTRLGHPLDGRGAASLFGCYGLSLAVHLFGLPRDVHRGTTRDAAGVDIEAGYLLSYDHHLMVIAASVGATLSNELRFYGDKARIVVPSPFLDATERILVEAGSGPWPRRIRVLYDPIHKRLPAVRARRGSGLRGEAAEVMRCLSLGLLESPMMPLDHTLAVHRLAAGSLNSGKADD